MAVVVSLGEASIVDDNVVVLWYCLARRKKERESPLKDGKNRLFFFFQRCIILERRKWVWVYDEITGLFSGVRGGL